MVSGLRPVSRLCGNRRPDDDPRYRDAGSVFGRPRPM